MDSVRKKVNNGMHIVPLFSLSEGILNLENKCWTSFNDKHGEQGGQIWKKEMLFPLRIASQS
jgi:hypothetical protein